MQKKYFGNYCLQNTVRTVKKAFPECKIRCFEDGAEKKVVVLFSPDDRKKYNISENVKTYRFLNKHLILTNGPMDPFKYDNLDALIEETELEYEINQKRTFIEKTKAALDSCMQFHDLAKVIIGNYVNGSFDIRLTLNEIERTYHIDNETTNVHMEKLDPETELTGAKEFQLSKLPPNVQYKILKTTHPGLLTAATEYISGIRDGKESWRNAADAYTAEWKRKYYMQFGIDAFDVLIDIPENILVGEYSTKQIRKLFLLDGSKFIYIKNPLQVIPYDEYEDKKIEILNNYKMEIMELCKISGLIPQQAIEFMNKAAKGSEAVNLAPMGETILKIKNLKIASPLQLPLEKIVRLLKLRYNDYGFSAEIRKMKKPYDMIHIDVNECGAILRFDIDPKTFTISEAYKTYAGNRREAIENIERYKMTTNFLNLLKPELEKIQDYPEVKLFKLGASLMELGIEDGKIFTQGDNIYKTFYLGKNRRELYIDPFEKKLSNANAFTGADAETMEQLKTVIKLYQELFNC